MRRREEQQRETIREGQAARREAEAPTVSLPAVGLTNTSVEAVPKRRKRDRLDPRKVRIGGKTFWQIQLGSEIRDGRRIRLRRTFRDLKEAQTYSDLKRIERRNHGAFSISLSEKLRSDAFHAFGLFGGLRAGELQRLLWEQVDFEHDLIEVTAKSSKTASRRSVTIQPNLRKWL